MKSYYRPVGREKPEGERSLKPQLRKRKDWESSEIERKCLFCDDLFIAPTPYYRLCVSCRDRAKFRDQPFEL